MEPLMSISSQCETLQRKGLVVSLVLVARVGACVDACVVALVVTRLDAFFALFVALASRLVGDGEGPDCLFWRHRSR